MEPPNLALAISAANFILTWGVALYMYLSNKTKVTNARIDRLEEDVDGRIDAHADAIARLEQDVRHGPSPEDVKRIHARIDTIDQRLSRMEGEFRGQSDTLRLILNQITQKGMA